MGEQTIKPAPWVGVLNSGPLWVLGWSLPLWAAVAPRLLRHKTPWLADFNPVVRAAQAWWAHLPIYSLSDQSMHPTASAYVYPPWIAAVFSAPVHEVGAGAILLGYAALFLAALALLFWLVFWRPMAGVDRRSRAPFLAFTSGNLIVVGNLAVVMQALIITPAVFLGADTIACTAAIALAGLVKPIYLTFLALPAFAPTSWARRTWLVGCTVAVVALPCLSSLPFVPEWRAFVLQISVDAHPGGGLLGWLGQAGVTAHPVLTTAYAVYAALVFGAGLILAETGQLQARQRVWLAATVAVLLLPRIMAYDLLLIGPGLLVASQVAGVVSARWAGWSQWLWRAACGLYLISSLIGGGFQVGHAIALMMVASGLVGLSVLLVAQRRLPNSNSLKSAPDAL